MVKDKGLLFLFCRVVKFLCLVYGLVSVAVVFLNLCLHVNPATEIELRKIVIDLSFSRLHRRR